MTWLIVGLGNPGAKYAGTRHNIGFDVVSVLGRRGMVAFKERFKGLFALSELGHQRVVLLMPQTFMNLSGESVRPACDFFKVEPDHVLVVHDELDVPFGDVRLKEGGGEAGHRGLRSISQHLGTQSYLRLRMGIGRPPTDFRGKVADFVLTQFAPGEAAELDDAIDRAIDATELLIERGIAAAMNQTNQKR